MKFFVVCIHKKYKQNNSYISSLTFQKHFSSNLFRWVNNFGFKILSN